MALYRSRLRSSGLLCSMRAVLPEADYGCWPPRVGFISAPGNGRAPKLRHEGYVEVAAHLHFTFTANAAVRGAMTHRFHRGRRFEPPVRRHLMPEQEAACRASVPYAAPPALRDDLHRRWTATFPFRDRNAWAPRIEAAPCDELSDSDELLILKLMRHNDEAERAAR